MEKLSVTATVELNGGTESLPTTDDTITFDCPIPMHASNREDTLQALSRLEPDALVYLITIRPGDPEYDLYSDPEYRDIFNKMEILTAEADILKLRLSELNDSTGVDPNVRDVRHSVRMRVLQDMISATGNRPQDDTPASTGASAAPQTKTSESQQSQNSPQDSA
ncbi:hypothetical protein HD806DRAFT_528236 [Xylariaceae sp. AK1471]|nr:hypothetical protein HD806DRAFT_528236 [Xylariaceae sp. AK1471]